MKSKFTSPVQVFFQSRKLQTFFQVCLFDMSNLYEHISHTAAHLYNLKVTAVQITQLPIQHYDSKRCVYQKTKLDAHIHERHIEVSPWNGG